MKILPIILGMSLLAGSVIAQAPSPQEMRRMQTEILRHIGAAIYIDNACTVLTKEAHTDLANGFAALRKDAMEGAGPFSQDEITALDKQSQQQAQKAGCNPEADNEVYTALGKAKQFQSLSGDDTQTAIRFFRIYGQMRMLNETCHFYNDEMTGVFAKKRDELGQLLQQAMPKAYEDVLLPESKALETKRDKITAEACADTDIQQMVTMMAWKATDTFASTPVSTPDCKAGARCDLPSRLFKK